MAPVDLRTQLDTFPSAEIVDSQSSHSPPVMEALVMLRHQAFHAAKPLVAFERVVQSASLGAAISRHGAEIVRAEYEVNFLAQAARRLQPEMDESQVAGSLRASFGMLTKLLIATRPWQKSAAEADALVEACTFLAQVADRLEKGPASEA